MATTSEIKQIRYIVWTALMAALISCGGIISIPIGAVPITLQNMFIMLAGLLLPRRYGISAVLLYLAVGCLGLPVFAGGRSGIATFTGPTGGYLFSFILMTYITSLKDKLPNPSSFLLVFLLCCLSVIATLVIGTIFLSYILNISLVKAWIVGSAPFIIGGFAKAFAATAIYIYFQKYNLLP